MLGSGSWAVGFDGLAVEGYNTEDESSGRRRLAIVAGLATIRAGNLGRAKTRNAVFNGRANYE